MRTGAATRASCRTPRRRPGAELPNVPDSPREGGTEREYPPLPIRELGPDAGFRRPGQAQAERVSLESPALEVMTDLLRTSPATIRPQAPIEGARRYMIARGVRLLIVA